MLNSIIASRTLKTTVKASLIVLSVGAGLTILLLTVLTAAFSLSSDKALELSQSIQIEDADTTEQTVETLALTATGAIEVENTVVESAPELAQVSILDEAETVTPAPVRVSVVIPKNATKATLRKMVTDAGLDAPLDCTKAELTAILRFA